MKLWGVGCSDQDKLETASEAGVWLQVQMKMRLRKGERRCSGRMEMLLCQARAVQC